MTSGQSPNHTTVEGLQYGVVVVVVCLQKPKLRGPDEGPLGSLLGTVLLPMLKKSAMTLGGGQEQSTERAKSHPGGRYSPDTDVTVVFPHTMWDVPHRV